MVWPTLGSRTAKEQNRTDFGLRLIKCESLVSETEKVTHWLTRVVVDGGLSWLLSAGDSVEFLSWFLNALHSCLGGGTKKSKETIVSRTFRGSMRIYSRKVPPIDMVPPHSATVCLSVCRTFRGSM